MPNGVNPLSPAQGGLWCPCCDATDQQVVGQDIELRTGTVWLDLFCEACAATWRARYTLHSVLAVKPGPRLPEGEGDA